MNNGTTFTIIIIVVCGIMIFFMGFGLVYPIPQPEWLNIGKLEIVIGAILIGCGGLLMFDNIKQGQISNNLK